MNYDIFLMNKSYGTDYALIDNNIPGGQIAPANKRYATWHFVERDGKTGPVEAIQEVVSQFNAPSNPSWMSYGSMSQVSKGDIELGHSLCLWNGSPVGGKHARDGSYAYVNPDVCKETGRDIRGVFIEEIFEPRTYTSDIHGDGSHVNGQDRVIKKEGEELIVYTFIKDQAQ